MPPLFALIFATIKLTACTETPYFLDTALIPPRLATSAMSVSSPGSLRMRLPLPPDASSKLGMPFMTRLFQTVVLWTPNFFPIASSVSVPSMASSLFVHLRPTFPLDIAFSFILFLYQLRESVNLVTGLFL